MKTHFALPLLKSWLLAWMMIVTAAAVRLSAATNVVLAGEDLQAKINAAASGDVLVVQSGAYGGAISVNKPLALVRSGTEELQLLGPVSINTAGLVAFSRFRFADVVTVGGGAAVSVLESSFQAAVGVTGGSLTARKTEVVGELRLTNAALTGLRLTNRAAITATAPANSGAALLLSQSVVQGDLEATGYRLHIGYSRCFSVRIADGEAVLSGVQLRKSGYGNAVTATRSRLAMKNCDLDHNPAGHPNYEVTFAVGIVDSAATIENCLISSHTFYYNPPHPISAGIEIQGDVSNVSILGSIVVSLRDDGSPQGVGIQRTGNAKVTVARNCIHCPGAELAGVTAHLCLFADPKLAADRTLAIDSPCRNAGPPEAIYNDRDGTRNDMGFAGGPLFNEANFTTDLPLAFWLDTNPRRVLKGVNNTLRVDAAAAAGH